MTFAWSPDMETGCADIDNQHKQLLAMTSALFEAWQVGRERQEMERTMDFLLEYVIKHFADEEKLQEKYDYPEYLAHKQLHVDFQGVVQGLVAKISQDGFTYELLYEICNTIGEWVIGHVKGEDLRMITYIQSKTQTA